MDRNSAYAAYESFLEHAGNAASAPEGDGNRRLLHRLRQRRAEAAKRMAFEQAYQDYLDDGGLDSPLEWFKYLIENGDKIMALVATFLKLIGVIV